MTPTDLILFILGVMAFIGCLGIVLIPAYILMEALIAENEEIDKRLREHARNGTNRRQGQVVADETRNFKNTDK